MKKFNIKNDTLKKFMPLLKFIFFIFTFYYYSSILLVIVELLLQIFSVSYTNLNLIVKIVILTIIDLSYIYIIYLLYKKDLKESFKDFKTNIEKHFDVGIRWWVLGFTIMGVSNLLISTFSPESISNNEEAVRSLISQVPAYMLFSVSIYAPFIEEMLFRKSLGDIFKNKVVYIIISAFLFGALHVIGSLDSVYSLLHLIPYVSLGVAFSIIYVKTKNVFVSMLFHCIHNSLAAILLIVSNIL